MFIRRLGDTKQAYIISISQYKHIRSQTCKVKSSVLTTLRSHFFQTSSVFLCISQLRFFQRDFSLHQITSLQH